jgi:hypothetical protein
LKTSPGGFLVINTQNLLLGMTEQQNHLFQIVEQQKQIINEINILNGQLNSKKEHLYKLQGAIEYLEGIGVSLPESDTEIEENIED